MSPSESPSNPYRPSALPYPYVPIMAQQPSSSSRAAQHLSVQRNRLHATLTEKDKLAAFADQEEAIRNLETEADEQERSLARKNDQITELGDQVRERDETIRSQQRVIEAHFTRPVPYTATQDWLGVLQGANERMQEQVKDLKRRIADMKRESEDGFGSGGKGAESDGEAKEARRKKFAEKMEAAANDEADRTR